MTLTELLAELHQSELVLSIDGHNLVIQGNEEALNDSTLIAKVREKRAELIEFVASSKNHRLQPGDVVVPTNIIDPESGVISPDQLPLITLTQADIDRVVTSVPGGVANVQDIYALSPLQDGILFHHLMATGGDPYLMVNKIKFNNRVDLDRCLTAAQQVVDRHDILRTAFHWEGLTMPAQVVLRGAKLDITEISLDPTGGPASEQMARRFDPSHLRIDLTQPPLLRFFVAWDADSGSWVLVQLFHHIIGDHSTLDTLDTEVRAILNGQGSTLAVPEPFRNLVAQARLGMSAEEHAKFFRELLGDIDAPTLPFGLRDEDRADRHVLQARRMLPERLNRKLRAQARHLRVSLASVCHLAWGQVVARTSGRESVVFGTVLFGRMQGGSGVDRAMGPFINTLPIRLDLDGTSVQTSVQNTHRRLASLLEHEHASLALAQRCSGVASPTPLFSALLNYRHNRMPESHDGAWSVIDNVESRVEERTNYPLSLSVEDFGSALGLTVQVVDCLSPARMLDLIQRALEQLIDALDTAPDRAVRQLDVLPRAERRLLLYGLNQTEAVYPAERCIQDLFEEQVKRAPEAIAIIEGEEQLTYAELNARANALAQRLIGEGVRPGDCVATLLERSAALIVAELAVLKVGGTYVPIDPQVPEARQRWMLDDCGTRLVLTGGETVGSWITSLALDASKEERGESSGIKVSSEKAAYVMYTSGSTGEPKGVVISHRAVNRLVFNRGYGDLEASDRVAWLGNPAFDISTFEVWAPLLRGGTVVVIGHGTVLEPEALRAVVQKNVTVLHLTAGLFGQVAEELGEALTGLRLLLIGGDRVDAAMVTRVLEKYPPMNFRHCYGPTEATTFATTYAITQADRHRPLPIGRPIANTRVYLLDGHGQPVPLGAEGEIYIGGAGVANGYLNRPELTLERFVKDPFCSERGARMYRTGDRGRYRADGNLEFLGRTDEQVKIRGYRVEPGEIEARLCEHETVHEAVVQARENAAGTKRLVGYVTARAGKEIELEALREHLTRQLPDYMVPAAFVVLEELPLTRNGKVDRNALPGPDAQAMVHEAYEPPEGEKEQKLAQIWSELLGLERVGRHDDFFKLGGHSLLAVQMVERLRRVGWGVEVRALFAHSVLAELAGKLGGGGEVAVPRNAIGSDTREITPELLPLITLTPGEIEQIVAWVPGGATNVQDIYRLSPLQDGILFHHVLATKGDPYLVSGQMVFAKREVLDRYLSAVQQVVDRHDILRTAVHWEGLSTPAQVVWRQAKLDVTEVELEADGGPANEQLARRYDPRHHRIDPRQAPLLRFIIAQEPGSDRWVALELQHHLIGDHTTLEIMHEEVRTILAGKGGQLGVVQPFRNLVAQAWLGTSVQAHEEFFREMLKGVDEPTLPFGLSDVYRDGRDVVQGRRMLPQGLNDRLRAQGRRLGVSLASLCHLAWGQVVARTSGRESVVFGTVLFGRMQSGAGADSAMGLFMNTLPVRLDLDDTPIEESVRRTHMRLADLLRHEHASLALAQRCSGVVAPTPLFSTLLNYRHIRQQKLEAATTSLDGIEWLDGEERTNYPLTMSVDDFGHALGLTVQVVECLGPERMCDLMQRALEQLADALQTTPRLPVRQLDVLPCAERKQILEGWNATEASYPRERCVHELFEEQVRRSPDAIAVMMGEKQVTYAELNAEANRLARELVARGVRPESLVAICMDRSVQLVVGLLAILKAGAAYVPLDPNYPAGRLGFMVADARPVLTLVSAESRTKLPEGTTALVLDDEELMAAVARHSDGDLDDGQLAYAQRTEHPAYVIYTSGSTGKPKGAINSHGSVVNRLKWMQAAYGIDATDRVLQKTPSSFDVSVWEFFCPLLAGGTLVLAEPEGHKDPTYLTEAIRRYGVTTVHFVPSMMRAFLGESSADRCTSLRRVICSGEVLSRELQTQFHGRLDCELHNLYGPTEAAVDVSAWMCREDDDSSLVPIGRPIWNTQLLVLNAMLQPVPVGVTGELYIAGQALARGYLDRSRLTAERFVANPFGEPGARMYRSGDLARHRPDGNVEFLGRSDDQVKIRGFRIELGEIEAQLRMHSGVRDAVVIAREDKGDQRLVAYVTALPNSEIEAPALREHLARRLPEYMVPTAFVRLVQMPRTPNGKLDRQALPAPDLQALQQGAYAPPEGEIERTLAAIWSELLGVEQIGRHDHFFELGGHSLLAVRFIAQTRRLNFQCNLQDLVANPVLADLARRIASQSAEKRHIGAVPIRRGGTVLPVFFVPSGAGDYSYVFELARSLVASLPVYALPWPSFRESSARTIEAMAARMVDLMRSVQSRGPYRVAGYSSGGVLAYAIAQHLLGLDECVSFVGLIDVNMMPPAEAPDQLTRSLFLNRIAAFASPNGQARIVELEKETRSWPLRAVVLEAQRLDLISPQLDREPLFWEQVKAFAAARRSYEPLALPLTIHLFHSIQEAARLYQAAGTIGNGSFEASAHIVESRDETVANAQVDTTCGWKQLLPPSSIESHAIPGDHDSIVTEPDCRAYLGARLSDAITHNRISTLPDRRPEALVALSHTDRTADLAVVIPGAGDSVTAFNELARVLASRVSIYGMQPRGVDPAEVPYVSVEAAAAAPAEAISRLVVNQPIHLIGHSYGGLVAYEIGRRLWGEGKRITSLTIIDTEPPLPADARPPDIPGVEIREAFVRAIELRYEVTLGLDASTSDSALRFLRRLHKAMSERRLISTRTSPEMLRGPLNTFSAACRSEYRPDSLYAGPVRLLLPLQDDEKRGQRIVAGWRTSAPKLEVSNGPGNHFTILGAIHASWLADWWLTGIQGQQETTRSAHQLDGANSLSSCAHVANGFQQYAGRHQK